MSRFERIVAAVLIAALLLCAGLFAAFWDSAHRVEPGKAVIEQHDGRSWIVFDHENKRYVIEFEEEAQP